MAETKRRARGEDSIFYDRSADRHEQRPITVSLDKGRWTCRSWETQVSCADHPTWTAS